MVVFLPLAALALAGCNHAEPSLAPPAEPQVEVSEPEIDLVTDYEDFPGRTDAVESVNVRARVTGYLSQSYVGPSQGQIREGTEVEEGMPLFVIDARLYKADLARAQATIAQNVALVERLTLDYQRAVQLRPTRAISTEDVDKVAGDRAAALAAVDVARAARDMARLNLEWTNVTAPISGRLGRRLVDPGNLVKADDTVLTNIVSQDPIYTYFDVPERTEMKFRRLIREGKIKSASEAAMPVEMELADEKGFPHRGVIDFMDNRVDPGTGTLKVRGVFRNPRDPNNPKQTRLLSPGLFARVRLQVGPPHKAILVAERALGTDQGQKFVYVVNSEDKVEYRRVKVGAPHSLAVWISTGGIEVRKEVVPLREIKEGLEAGERVVVNGLQRVRPGVKIRPQRVSMLSQLTSAGPGAVVWKAASDRR
jgi:RND family efflux transporter MFP subunit